MSEAPISTLSTLLLVDDFITKLSKFPQKRILFFTVKDNTHSTKWDTIGKINDWIRRYSDLYIIVRGMEDGVHFHGLAGIKINNTPKCQKGIHMCLKTINDTKKADIDYIELKKGKEKALFFTNERVEDLTADVLTPNQQDCLRVIVLAIRRYWHNKQVKVATTLRNTKKIDSIRRIISYLEKNLAEPREEDVEQYVDYIFKY